VTVKVSLVHACAVTLPRQMECTSAANKSAKRQQTNRQDKPAQPTKQQKAEGRRNTSPVLLPLDKGDGI